MEDSAMHRRKFLRIAGTSAVVLAATGIGAGSFIATRKPEKALAPWRSAGTNYPDPMRRALSYAILAPNPHNRQPWTVDLKSDTEAVLRCDLERLLPETDPFDRQIVIGMGCFIELFVLAAGHDGYRAEVSLFPEGAPAERLDARPVALFKLVRDNAIEAEPLFAQVFERHTNRNPYDLARSVDEAQLEAIKRAPEPGVIVGAVGAGELLQPLRELTQVALRDELLNPAAFGESVELMRIGRREIEANPDGISLSGPLLDAMGLVGMLTRQKMADPASSSFQIGLDMADEQALSAMGFVWINTRGNSRAQQISAGRAYLRVALQVAGLGLAMQPMSQALQEYAAMRPHFDEARRLLSDDGDERVQMLARLGYAETVDPSPRWALATRINRA